MMTMLTERQDEEELFKLLNQAKNFSLTRRILSCITLATARVTIKQEKQCKYKVTLKCFRATIVAVEKQYPLRMVRLCL